MGQGDSGYLQVVDDAGKAWHLRSGQYELVHQAAWDDWDAGLFCEDLLLRVGDRWVLVWTREDHLTVQENHIRGLGWESVYNFRRLSPEEAADWLRSRGGEVPAELQELAYGANLLDHLDGPGAGGEGRADQAHCPPSRGGEARGTPGRGADGQSDSHSDADTPGLRPADRDILEALEERGPLQGPEIARRAGYDYDYVRARLTRLVKQGRLTWTQRGYSLARPAHTHLGAGTHTDKSA